MANKRAPFTTRFCYFDFSGLGDPCRFMLAYGDEKFVDDRMTREEFVERKDRFPFGKVPYLEIDGLFLHQSMAICRYLAKKYGIAGSTPQAQVEADIMADTINDVRGGLATFYWESDEATKARKKEPAIKQANEYLDKLEAIVVENGGNFVKGELTWPDVVFGSLAGYICHMAGSDLLTSRPALRTLKYKILDLPGIKSYLSTRPPVPF